MFSNHEGQLGIGWVNEGHQLSTTNLQTCLLNFDQLVRGVLPKEAYTFFSCKRVRGEALSSHTLLI